MNADPSLLRAGARRRGGAGPLTRAPPHRSDAAVRRVSSAQSAPHVVLVCRAMTCKWRGRALQLEFGPRGEALERRRRWLGRLSPSASRPRRARPSLRRASAWVRDRVAGRPGALPGFQASGVAGEAQKAPGHPAAPAPAASCLTEADGRVFLHGVGRGGRIQLPWVFSSCVTSSSPALHKGAQAVLPLPTHFPAPDFDLDSCCVTYFVQ